MSGCLKHYQICVIRKNIKNGGLCVFLWFLFFFIFPPYDLCSLLEHLILVTSVLIATYQLL